MSSNVDSYTVLVVSAASNIHTVRWVNALADRGLVVHLAFLPDHPPSKHKISSNVILHPLKVSGSIGYYANARKLQNLYSEIKPDLVNAHYASGYGTLARRAKLRPLLLSVWGSDVYDFPYKNFINMRIVKRNLSYADALASTSYSMAEQVNKLVDNTKIYITPFGVKSRDFLPKTFSDKINTTSIIRIGNIKTLKSNYGIDTLIKATFYLLESLTNHGYGDVSKRIRVDIYGDGPQKKELIALIESLGLSNIVTLKGAVPNTEVPKILNSFDVFCCTSNRESFGVAVVEAMAASLPVVATDVDGFREVTADGKTAILVERNSPRSVAVALESVIVSRPLQQLLGESGRKRVIGEYDWDNNVEVMLGVYDTVVSKK